jgi:glycosyltransferase involved in cell wall biosynthesis
METNAHIRKHICIVTETFPPELNGVALTMLQLTQNLVKAGFRVSIIRPDQGHAIESKRGSEDHMVANLVIPSISLKYYDGLRVGKPAYRRLVSFFTDYAVDAVYIATEGPLGIAAMLAARRRRKFIMTGFHTRFDHYMAHYGMPWLTRVCQWYLRQFHNRAHHTFVATESLVQELKQLGIKRAEVAQRGVDTHCFNPRNRSSALRESWGVSDNQPVVICVGRIAAEKNLQVLIDAHNRYFAYHQAKLVIVGDGPLLDGLQTHNPNVIFTGRLTGTSLLEAFASADIFAFPSMSETFGNVILEAMASGLAIVAFDYAAAKSSVLNSVHGSIVEYGNEGDFHSALGFELDRWRSGIRIGTASREAMESRTPDSYAKHMIRRIEQSLTSTELNDELRKNIRQVA